MSIAMRISMMIISRGSLGLPLAIITVMAISTIRVSVTVMIIPGLRICLPLAIISMVAVSMAITMRVTMMIISRLGISFSYSSWLSLPLAVVSMMTVTTISITTVAMMTITSISITTIAMMVISWLSNSCAKDGKEYSNLKELDRVRKFLIIFENLFSSVLLYAP